MMMFVEATKQKKNAVVSTRETSEFNVTRCVSCRPWVVRAMKRKIIAGLSTLSARLITLCLRGEKADSERRFHDFSLSPLIYQALSVLFF